MHVRAVEDDDAVAAALLDMLGQLGHRGTHVGTVAAGLAALAGSDPVHLVFYDMLLPGGGSGPNLAREMARHGLAVPMVLTSNYGGGATQQRLAAANLPFLRKPYRLDALRQAIEAALPPDKQALDARAWPALPLPPRRARERLVRMVTVLLIVHLFVTIALIGVVLIQRSEGGGLGIGGSQGMGAFMGGRGTANLLTRTTAILATVFMALSLALALMNRGTSGVGGRSVLDLSTLPAAPASAPASPAPAAPSGQASGAPQPAAPPAPSGPSIPTK